MGEPLLAGVVHETVAVALPATAVMFVGTAGGPAGTTAFEAVDAGEVPTPFVAVTVNV